MDYQTNVGTLEVRFFDNETGLGFLINQPGIPPVIYLNRTLLGEDQSELMYQEVYGKLLDLHHTMNVWERVVPFRRFYEDLIPEEIVQAVEPGPRLIEVSHKPRPWRIVAIDYRMRVIGLAADLAS
jgi:hypothetical protein